MNKYQKAFEWINSFQDNWGRVDIEWGAVDEIRELVDKATPMKPINQYLIDFGLGNYGDCRICNYGVNYQQNYCDNCGQALDWNNDG